MHQPEEHLDTTDMIKSGLIHLSWHPPHHLMVELDGEDQNCSF